MKRHPALRQLSVDHHHGLVQAQRLLKAAANPSFAAAAAAQFLEFWKGELNTHFTEEEQVLLPIVALHAPAALNSGPVATMLLQHAQLRGMILEMANENPRSEALPGIFEQLGTLLEEHIRLEERVIFPEFQAALPPAILDELEVLLRAAVKTCASPSAGAPQRPSLV